MVENDLKKPQKNDSLKNITYYFKNPLLSDMINFRPKKAKNSEFLKFREYFKK